MSKRVTALLAAVTVLGAVACGNAPTETSGSGGATGGGPTPMGTADPADLSVNIPSDQPGVTDTEIRVGGVASVTNPLGGPYGQAFKGVQAYFEMINARGGIYGRQLKLVAERDDKVANNQTEIQGLLSQDKVFAVLPVASLLFTGAQLLADEGVPTFGWTIQPDWQGPPNLFGEKGSNLCIDCPFPVQPWLTREIGATKVGVLGYGISEQSKLCTEGIKRSFEKYPAAEIAYVDSAVPFGATDLSVQVSRMKEAGVDFVTTCMDTNGATSLAKEMDRQQLDAVQYLQNGYDYSLVEEFADVFDGAYVMTGFVPFEVSDPPPGLRNYFEWIDRVGGERGESSLYGWLNADLFYRGLVAAGPEFTRQSVIDAINTMTDWDADGIVPGVDWTTAHETPNDRGCYALSRIENGRFVPQFGEPGKPFVCFDFEEPLPDEPERAAGVR
jgi:ABC-type branched-subunit amino acid transport system substrate-binding protein